MSCVAEFTIPPESFPFGETLVSQQDIEIHVDQIIPTDESALPFFWVHGCDSEQFMTYAEDELEVQNTQLLERVNDTALFRAEWSPNDEIIDGLKDLEITIVEAVGTAENWRFEVRTQNRDEFQRFRDLFTRQGIPIELERLYSLEDLINGEDLQLTPDQRETLLTAHQEGYFDEPRKVTQSDLAEKFGISRRAIADRLRRGTKNLIAETLLPSGRDLT